jgi:aldose sugar dehydrogenase
MRHALLWACLAACWARADTLDPSVSGLLTRTDLVTGQGPITDFRWLPDGRLVFVEKTGAVKLRSAAGAISTAYTFCVSTVSEQGLLGVEVDPDFGLGGNHRLFFYYSNCAADGGTDTDRQRVVSMDLDPVSSLLDPASERVLVRGLQGPANHDGGGLAIGPDRKLYIGVGDTGCNCSCAPGSATNLFATCLSASPAGNSGGNGKVLRVNLDGSIPSDNPLVGVAQVTACGATCTAAVDPAVTGPPRLDVWAWGFRNPFRLWTDPRTGTIWVGDVGEVSVEELDLLQRGKHFGWPFREGWSGQDGGVCDHWTPGAGRCVEPVYACRHDGYSDPQYAYDPGCTSITLGAIVDACSWPASLRGRMVFGDSTNGSLWSLPLNAARDAPAGPRADFGLIEGGVPVAFHAGPDGNLYIGVYGGRIVKLAATSPGACDGGTGAGGGGGSGGGGSGGGLGGGPGGGSGGGGSGGGGSAGGGGGLGGGPGGGAGGGAAGGGPAGGGGAAQGGPPASGCTCSTVVGQPVLLVLVGSALRRRRRAAERGY